MLASKSAWLSKAVFAMLIATGLAFGAILAAPIINPGTETQAYATAKAHNFKFTHTALLVNGKGTAYKSYTKLPGHSIIVYKARIKGGKLYVRGTMNVNGKFVRYNGKGFKLTAKTKYYRHLGNGSFYESSSKSKIAKSIANRSSRMGGDIHFIVKKGVVTVLAVA